MDLKLDADAVVFLDTAPFIYLIEGHGDFCAPVRELVAEVDDPASVGDARGQARLEAQQRVDRLADEDELALDPGTGELGVTVGRVVDAGQEALDGPTGAGDVGQVGEDATRHRAAAWCARSRGRCRGW